MACNPPYNCSNAPGSGGFCNCNCGVCPPCPCFKKYTFEYTCTEGTGGSSTLELSFDGCCLKSNLEISGTFENLSLTFIAIGSGLVSVTGETDITQLITTIKLNGTETRSLSVENCDEFTLNITNEFLPGSTCIQYEIRIGPELTSLIPECGTASPFIKRRNKTTGATKLYIDRNILLQKLALRKRR